MNSTAPFRLGDWLVQPDLNRVVGPDGDVRLEPRVMLVLLCLAREPGAVVGRDALLDEVWEGTFVGEESLTRAISDLRRAFGDNARRPAYIETIRQKGYRLVAAVVPAGEADAAPEPVPETAPVPAPEPEPTVADDPAAAPEPRPQRPLFPERPPRKPFRPWGTLASVAIIAALLVGQRFLFDREEPEPGHAAAPASRTVPLTTYPGHERQPALSADGTRVAFAWSGSGGEQEGIWVKQRNSETPLRLSEGPGRAAWPVWSPDGQSVAWVQVLGDSSEIRSVPSLGGAVRTLYAAAGLVAGLDWHPDGGRILFSDPGDGFHSLASLDLESLETVREPDDGLSRIQPRAAPDGRRLAFVGLTETASGVVIRQDDRDNWLVRGLTNVQGLAWTADGTGLVYAVEHAGMYRLWMVAAEGGAPRPLTAAGEFAWNPTIARGTGDLAWEQVRVDQDLWRIRVHGRDPWRLETGRFLASTRWEYEAAYSPDGAQLAFVSARSGTPELWICARDGSDPRRLTDVGGAPVTNPCWSGAGDRVAFNVLEAGHNQVQVIAARGGTATTVTPPGSDEVLVGWAERDSALEYLTGTDLRRRPLDPADGQETLLREGVAGAARDPQGRLFAVGSADSRTITGPGAAVEGLDPLDRRNWRVADDALYWVLRRGGRAFLMVRALGTEMDEFMTDLPGFTGTGLAVAPDGSEILYTRSGASEGDLVLLPGS